MGLDRDGWLAILMRPFPSEAIGRFRASALALEERLATASPGPSFDPVAFDRARLVGSHSLEKGRVGSDVFAAWARANTLLAGFVAESAELSWAGIRMLNGVLRGRDEDMAFRTGAIHLGPYPCPGPEDIEALLAPMLGQVASRDPEVHPIAAAALAGQWIVSVHPFDDANGRTARLVTDWLLAAHGYPPATYPDFLASVNALLDHEHGPLGVEETANVLLGGIENTLAFLTR